MIQSGEADWIINPIPARIESLAQELVQIGEDRWFEM